MTPGADLLAFAAQARLVLARLDRAHARREVSDEAEAEAAARRAWRDLMSAARVPRSDLAALAADLDALLATARRSPAPSRTPDPLLAGEVDGGEVVELLRRVLAGEARVAMIAPPKRWAEVGGAPGEVTVEGWRLRLRRRGEGGGRVAEVLAPDRRRGDADVFAAGEGDPVALLTDAERDRLDDLLGSLAADADATRAALDADEAAGFRDPALSTGRVFAWTEIAWGDELGPDLPPGLRYEALQATTELPIARAFQGDPGITRELAAQAVWLDEFLDRLDRVRWGRV